MNNFTIFIVVSIFLIIYLIKLYIISTNNTEHLTSQSDEAIQNLASLYNKDNLTIGNINATGTVTAGTVTAGKLIDNSLGTNMSVASYIQNQIGVLTNTVASLDSKIADINVQLGDSRKYPGVNITQRIDWLGANAIYKGRGYKLSKDDDGYMWGKPVYMNE